MNREFNVVLIISACYTRSIEHLTKSNLEALFMYCEKPGV